MISEEEKGIFSKFFCKENQAEYFDNAYPGVIFWKELFKEQDKFLEDHFKEMSSFTTSKLLTYSMNEPNYENLGILLDIILEKSQKNSYLGFPYDNIIIGKLEENGKKSLMFLNRTLYINMNHPYTNGSFNLTKVYGLLSDLVSEKVYLKYSSRAYFNYEDIEKIEQVLEDHLSNIKKI